MKLSYITWPQHLIIQCTKVVRIKYPDNNLKKKLRLYAYGAEKNTIFASQDASINQPSVARDLRISKGSIGIICDVYIKVEDIGRTGCVCIKVRDCSITPPGGLSNWGLLPPIARRNANCNH